MLRFSLYSRNLISVMGSDQLCGVARMTSPVDFDSSFHYWWDFNRWTGLIKIEWVYITDLHFDAINYIYQNENPVSNLRDGTELQKCHGVNILNKFKTATFVSDIFEAFDFMDKREIRLRKCLDFNKVVFERIKSKKNKIESDRTSNKYFGSSGYGYNKTKSKKDDEESKSFYYENDLN